jgi:hypothetical protein
MKNMTYNKYTWILLTIAFVISVINATAQTLTGKIADANTRNPITLANVVVKNVSDSLIVSGTATNADGFFNVEAKDNTFLSVSFLGYETRNINTNEFKTSDTIFLNIASENLDEAVAVAQIKPFELSERGIVANVQSTILSKMGNANDVLSKLPFIVKKGDNFEVLGKGVPLIYVNNRLLRSNIDLELQQINSTTIKKVEIITNPGAEYDATVKSVIKITTLKQAGEGLSSILQVKLEQTKTFSHNEQISLNYRHKNLDVFSSVSYFDHKLKFDENLNNSFHFNNINTNIENIEKHNNHGKRLMVTTGFNMEINSSHSFGTRYMYSNLLNNKTNSNGFYKSTINNISDSISSDVNTEESVSYHHVNSYYSGNFSEKFSVKLDMDYSTGKSQDDDKTSNRSGLVQNIFESQNKNSYDLFAGKVMFDINILDGIFNFGGEYSYTKDNQHYDILNSTVNTGLVSNNNLSKQNILAAFATYSKPINNILIEAGLRYENLRFDYFENGLKNSEQSKTYKALYPNVAISYKNDVISTSLGFRSTVQRPGYHELRNSVNYINEFTYEAGNPYLKPMRSNNFTYMFSWNDLYFMASYSMLKNQIIFDNSQYSNENIILYKPVNIAKSQDIVLSSGYSRTIGIWSASLELSMQKQFLKSGNPQLKYNKPIFLVDFQNTFEFSQLFDLLIEFSGNTNGNTNIAYYYNNYRVNIGFVKIFLNRKLRLNLKVNDIFNSDKEKWTMNVNNIHTSKRGFNNFRGVTFSVTYLFNNTQSKYKGEAASKELDRVSK